VAPPQGLLGVANTMQLIQDLSSIRLDRCYLTIGSFDGVHRGHQKIIQGLVSDAKAAGIPAVALTFFPHPSAVFRGRKPFFYITSPEEKAALLGNLGVDYVITQRFDLELARIRASSYLDLLQEQLNFHHLWVGEDFAFGYQREGDRDFLERASAERGFHLRIVTPVRVDGEVVSSTRIRNALRAGEIGLATAYLGRHFTITGEVVAGSDRGKRLGFPTANLRIQVGRAYPGPGVYVCLAEVAGQRWKAVTNIGVRPTFEESQGATTMETHLLDFDDDLYHQEVELTFIERLREEKRFSNPEALVSQIKKDIQRSRQILDVVMERDDV
jgi:riboflavin kinase/FMN adenylyltransferase